MTVEERVPEVEHKPEISGGVGLPRVGEKLLREINGRDTQVCLWLSKYFLGF
jgi:hypothetical protein